MFGPTDPLLGAHVQSICEALDVPHLEARLDSDAGESASLAAADATVLATASVPIPAAAASPPPPPMQEFSINLHPSQRHLNHALKDLISFLNWTKVAIVYEQDYGEFSFTRINN